MIGIRPYRSDHTPQKGTNGRPKRKNAAFRYPVHAGTSEGDTCTVARYSGMNRKTWETVKASTVDTIPKRTSSLIHPDALRVDAASTAPADTSADYRCPHAARRPARDELRSAAATSRVCVSAPRA